VALLERARAEIHGLTISELCEAKGWSRVCFYNRTRKAAERVAAYLNEHGGEVHPDMDALQQENSS
jgi:shikimate 5-dehydrogenase